MLMIVLPTKTALRQSSLVFNSVNEYVRHAETICEESEQVYGKEEFAKFLEHVHTGLSSNDEGKDLS